MFTHQPGHCLKILLTGGSGFIGSAVLDALASRAEVEVFALTHKKPLIPHAKNVRVITGGMANVGASRLVQIKPDVVLHLARPTMPALRGLGRKLAAFSGYWQNAAFIKNIVKTCPQTRLVYVSGSLMYGINTHGQKHTEQSELNPISFARDYVRTEQPILTCLHEGKMPVTVLRVPWVLGAGSWFGWVYGSHFTRFGTIPVFGDGQNQMHFILRKDFAKWMCDDLLKTDVNGIRNVFSPTVMTQLEFANMLAHHLGCTLDHHTGFYEKAIREAFTSTIELGTDFNDVQIAHSAFSEELVLLAHGLLENKQRVFAKRP